MSIPYELLVTEDLNLGYGDVDVSMPGGGSQVGTKIGLHTFFDTLHIRDFGGKPDGSDTTIAFNAALAVAATLAGRSVSIQFGPGAYDFLTKPNRIGTGVTLLGNGSAGTTSGYGTRLVCRYPIGTATEGFLEWDGSGVAYAGSGGGYENLQIYRGTYSGGTAVKLSGADDNHRAGFWKCDKFVIATVDGTTWNKGFVVDGTGLVTAGSKGIREVRVLNGLIASCSDADSNLWLYNAVHFYGHALHFVPSESANCGMTVTGPSGSPSTNVFISASNIDGNLALDYVDNLHWHGRIGANLTTTVNGNTISVHGAVSGTLSIHSSLSTQLHLDTAVYAHRLVPLVNADDSATYAGISMVPMTAGEGADFVRARSVDGSTGIPLGLATTPATGGAGSPYLAYNTNQKPATNEQTYFRTGYPAFRYGNPLGNGTYPIHDFVAPAGTIGDDISWVTSRRVHGTTGVQEFPAGLAAGNIAAGAFGFTVLTGTASIDPVSIANGASSVTNHTVAGASVGDTVLASYSGLTTGAWVLSAYVSATNNVKIYLINLTGEAVDLPAGTLRVDVIHHL